MALTLIGTGISFDLTFSAVETLKGCDRIYWEGYTGLIPEERIGELQAKFGKELIRLERNRVESSFLINEAKSAKIALLTSGDPLTATTHIALLLEAKRAHIDTQVISNASIYTVAPGKTGLQIYRFGKTASLVNPRPNYKPTSSFDIVRENLEHNLHTLVLLDTEPHFMDAKTALEMLENAHLPLEKIAVLSRVGFPDEKISYGEIKALQKADLGKTPFTIIVPAKLHPMEEESLQHWHVVC